MTRAPIYNALFSQLAGTQDPVTTLWSHGWVTASQTLRLWKQVGANEMPALFLALKGEVATPLGPSGIVTKWTIHMDAWVYVMHDGGPSHAMLVLATQLDRIEAAMKPAVGQERQTLGGLVYSAKIQGDIETDEGSLGDQAMAVVPITIVVSP